MESLDWAVTGKVGAVWMLVDIGQLVFGFSVSRLAHWPSGPRVCALRVSAWRVGLVGLLGGTVYGWFRFASGFLLGWADSALARALYQLGFGCDLGWVWPRVVSADRFYDCRCDYYNYLYIYIYIYATPPGA